MSPLLESKLPENKNTSLNLISHPRQHPAKGRASGTDNPEKTLRPRDLSELILCTGCPLGLLFDPESCFLFFPTCYCLLLPVSISLISVYKMLENNAGDSAEKEHRDQCENLEVHLMLSQYLVLATPQQRAYSVFFL